MSLYTGKRLNSYEWNEIYISDEGISRVEALTEDEKAPLIADGYPMFKWSPGVPIIDELEEYNDNNNNDDDQQEEAENEEIIGNDENEN